MNEPDYCHTFSHKYPCDGIGDGRGRRPGYCICHEEMEKREFEKQIPCRMWCAICGGPHKIDFVTKDEYWKEAIPVKYWLSPVCLNCFTARADEKHLPWENGLTLTPCSLKTQLDIQNKIKE